MPMPTVEELKTNMDLLQQINSGIRAMFQAHSLVIRGSISTIDLTADQKQELVDQYLVKKAEIATLYAGLF